MKAKRYFKYNPLPILKNIYKHPLKSATVLLALGTMFGGIREGYEELTTENTIVNIGPVILKHKESAKEHFINLGTAATDYEMDK